MCAYVYMCVCVCVCACMRVHVCVHVRQDHFHSEFYNAFGGGLTYDFDDHFQQYFLYRPEMDGGMHMQV